MLRGRLRTGDLPEGEKNGATPSLKSPRLSQTPASDLAAAQVGSYVSQKGSGDIKETFGGATQKTFLSYTPQNYEVLEL